MKILALESGDKACSVAIWQDGELLERSELAPRQQTRLLLPWSKQLLADAGLSLAQLDAIAFGHGPGAFTGVRLATSVAQGLAFSHDLPVVGVSTLASIALQLSEAQPEADYFLPLLDARMQEVYLGAYERNETQLVTPLVADCVCAPDSLPELPSHEWLAGGSGLVWQDTLAQQLRLSVGEADLYPQAAAIARLAAPKVAQGDTLEASRVSPVYLRNQVIQGAIR